MVETLVLMFKLLGLALLISAVVILAIMWGYYVGKGIYNFLEEIY